MMENKLNLLTIKEASKLLKVHPNTLRIWDKDGLLQAIRIGKRQGIRYRRSDIDKLLTKSLQMKSDPSRKLLGNISDRVPAMVAAYNIKTGQYIYVNKAVKSLLGYAPTEFVKKGFPFIASLVHPDDMPRIAKENQTALEAANKQKKHTDEPIVNFEYRMRHKDGSWKWLHTDGSVLGRARDGTVEYVLNISLDITARKLAEAKARKLAEQLDIKVKRRTQQLGLKEKRERHMNKVGKILMSSLDNKVILKKLAKVILEDIADFCRIVFINPDNNVQEATVDHINPNKIKFVNKLHTEYAKIPAFTYGIPQILKTRRSQLVPEINKKKLEKLKKNPLLYEAIKQLGLTSYMGIPLVTRKKIIGAIAFASVNGNRVYTRDDLKFAEEVGRFIALSVDNARLFKSAKLEIEERKEIQIKLLQNQARLELAHKAAQIGTFEWTAKDKKIYWSPEMETLYGLKPGTFKGRAKDWLKFFTPSDRKKLQSERDAQLQFGGDTDVTFKITWEDHSTHWLYSKAKTYFDKNKKPAYTIGINMDVTDRMNTEKNLEFLSQASKILSSSLDYQTTLNSLAKVAISEIADWCGIDIIDENNNIHQVAVAHRDPKKVKWAKAYRKANPPDLNSKYGFGAVIKTGKSELYPVVTQKMIEESMTDKTRIEITKKLNIKSVMMVPLFSGGKSIGVISFVTSDSGRYYNNQDLMMAEELANRASLAIDNARLYKSAQEAITLRDNFISVASHELKTPITSVKIFNQILEQHSQQIGDKRATQYLNKMDRQLNKLTELIYNLLDISRIQAGKIEFNMTNFDFDDTVHDVIDVLQESSSRHKLMVKGATGKKIYGDQDRIEQVVSNLVSNAIKYSPRSDKIIITLFDEDGSVGVSVKDYGIGIAKEHLTRIFERFYRVFDNTDKTFPGLGIGLYISNQIVKRHKGRFWVESGNNHGSTFYFTIPINAGKIDQRVLHKIN